MQSRHRTPVRWRLSRVDMRRAHRTSLTLTTATVDQHGQIVGAVNPSLTVSGHHRRCPAQGHIVQSSRPGPHTGRLHFIGLSCLLRCVRRKPSPRARFGDGFCRQQRDGAQAGAVSQHHCHYFDADGRTLEFPSDFAVQRIRAAATQRDGEEQQAPHQWVLPPAARVRPAIAVGPMCDERDDAELDRYCCCEEPRESSTCLDIDYIRGYSGLLGPPLVVQIWILCFVAL